MFKVNRKARMWGSLIVLLCLLVGIIFMRQGSSASANLHPAVTLLNKADVTQVSRGPLADVIYFTGDLIPREQTIISAEVDARVLKVLVDEGQIVQAGQILAQLDTLDLAQAVSQQEAELSSAKAKYELDQQKMEKQLQLYQQGFVSKIAYDELVTNAKASFQFYKVKEAMLKRSKRQLADTRVVAPFNGIIYQRSVEQGQLALKNTKLFGLANLQNLEIKAAVPSDLINKVALGQSVKFRVETDNHDYTGKISRINQVAEAGTRSYMVYIDFANQNAGLKAGQFIKGSVILQNLTHQNILSCDALRNNNQGDYVLVLSQGKIDERRITLILANTPENKCAISGVQVGELVLAGNVLTVKAGDQAKVVD